MEGGDEPMTEPTCTCHPVPEQYHTTHYGATEPGSTLEPDYECPVHFPDGVTIDPFFRAAFGMFLPKPKRKWGDAPAEIVSHRGGWIWACYVGWVAECLPDGKRLMRRRKEGGACEGVGTLPTHTAALEALAEHQEAEHACPALWEVDGASLRCELLAGHVEIGTPADHSWVQDLPIRIEPQASERSGV
jgi:hypothetical protein